MGSKRRLARALAANPPSQGSDRTLRATAYHEAGHAVAHLTLGHNIKSVDIIRREDSKGTTFGTTNCGNIHIETFAGKGRDAIFPHLVALAAGVCAESRVRRDAFEMSGKSDQKFAQKIATMAICDFQVEGELARIPAEELERKEPLIQEALREARQEAIRLVEEHFDAVKRVAEQLLLRQSLTGSEVARIVGDNP